MAPGLAKKAWQGDIDDDDNRAHLVDIYLDWDGTITHEDTLDVVAKIAYDAHGLPLKGHQSQYPYPAMSWPAVGHAYMQALAKYQRLYQPPLDEPIDLRKQSAWLEKLRDVELHGVQVAESTGLFKGIPRMVISEAAIDAIEDEHICIRPGFYDMVDTFARDRQSLVNVISVNWSALFVLHCLRAGAIKAAPEGEEDAACEWLDATLAVYANNIQIPGSGPDALSNGRLQDENPMNDIRTSGDKLLHLSPRCRYNLGRDNKKPPGAEESVVVYIGDSMTDLECVLAADVGMIMQDRSLTSTQHELAQTLHRLGYQIQHVDELDMDAFFEDGAEERTVYAIADFEINCQNFIETAAENIRMANGRA